MQNKGRQKKIEIERRNMKERKRARKRREGGGIFKIYNDHKIRETGW